METAAPVKRLVFHGIPLHPDDELGFWLLREFGEQKYPGIREAEIVFRTDAGGLFEGKTWQEHAAEGTRMIGTGGSPWDEHPVAGQKRKEGSCAASLIAEELGISKDPAIQFLLRWVVRNDTQGVRESSMDFAGLARDSFLYLPEMSPRETLFMHLLLIKTAYRKSQQFWKCENEFAKNGKKVQAGGVVIAAVESPNHEMARYCRSKGGIKADLVIHKGSPNPGLVQITRGKAERGERPKVSGATMDRIIAAIRWREAEINVRDHPRTLAELSAEGQIACAPEWFYLNHVCHNGGFTYQGVPGTKIPLGELLEMAAKAVTNQ